LENKPSTSRGVKIYEGRAGSASRTQSATSKSSNRESSEISSEEPDGESDHMVAKETGKSKPTSAAVHAKETKLKGQEFLKKQYKKFDLILLAKPKKKKPQKSEEEVITQSGNRVKRTHKKPDRWKYPETKDF
jgi:hypothetical protein